MYNNGVNKYSSTRFKERNDENILSREQEIPLSDTDRITYVFKYQKFKSKSIKVIEVTSVTYEIITDNKWMTIIYYDSTHGNLHRHIRISLINTSDTVTTKGVKKKGDHASWLKWAIKDLQNRYVYYKKEFLKRSKQDIIDRE